MVSLWHRPSRAMVLYISLLVILHGGTANGQRTGGLYTGLAAAVVYDGEWPGTVIESLSTIRMRGREREGRSRRALLITLRSMGTVLHSSARESCPSSDYLILKINTYDTIKKN